MILIARISAAIDAAGTTTTLLVGNVNWATGPSDTPANTPVRGRLLEAGNFQRDMGAGRSLFGAVRPSQGVAKASLMGGQVDDWARYGFGWRAYDLFGFDPADPYEPLPAFPSGWTHLMSATVEAAEFDDGQLTLRLRDRLALLDKPVCTQYAGTGGIEGPTSLAGQPRPRIYGQCCNVTPVLVDETNGIYQVSDKPYTQPRNAYDRRSALTPTSSSVNDAADFGALQALVVAGGSFARWSNGGMLKVGSAPVLLTVDAQRHDASYSNAFGRCRIGEVLADVATDAGLVLGTDIDTNLAALETSGGASLGIYVNDTSTTYLDALGQLAASRGAWVGFNRLGVLTGGIVASPSGSPAATFRGGACISVRRLGGAYPVPAKSVTVRGGKNWTQMEQGDVVGISEAQKQSIAQEFIYTERATGSAGAKHLNAPDEVIDTLSGQVNQVTPSMPGNSVGISPSAWMALFGVERDTVEVVEEISAARLAAVDLGSVVSLQWDRYGFDAGRLMLVIGVRYAFSQGRATFILWG